MVKQATMNNDIQTRMLTSVYACLLPLAKLLIRSGITYRQFETIAKRAFVHQAMAEAESRGRPTNTSRVAVRTGLSRKDVKRIRDCILAEPMLASGSTADQSGPPARVLHAWHSDRRFADVDGKPRDLDFQDEGSGFYALVHAVAGDVPPGAVRAELRRAGAIEELHDGKLRVLKRHYVPGHVDEKAITVMSSMVFHLTAGIVHNTDPDRTTGGFIQRIAFSDSLQTSAVPQFRQWSREQATAFIEKMDDWIAAHENPELASAEHQSIAGTVGVGVFYYEGPSAETVIQTSPPFSK
jgi:hypothetical protein